MPVLSRAQRRAGRELCSKTAVADSKQTLLCTYLSAVLLLGLVLNSTLRWWWADAGTPRSRRQIVFRSSPDHLLLRRNKVPHLCLCNHAGLVLRLG